MSREAAGQRGVGVWVLLLYGWTGKEKRFIVPTYASALYALEVDPSTVGQYTGLKDKNDSRIFEGDYLQDKFGVIYEVDHCEQWAAFRLKKKWCKDENGGMVSVVAGSESFIGMGWRGFEVIGNIHDNPEMIGGIDD